ncbi:proteasome assembly chaperone 2, partial [Dimargaris cristalligena]
PAISIGNVPQLCCDLVISTLRLERVGFLNDPNVTPFVGPKAYDHARSNLSTALEVFQCSTGKFTVIQQRAPILRKQQRAFVENLAQFITDGSFTRVMLLSTIDATLRDDRQLTEGSSRKPPSPETTPGSSNLAQDYSQLSLHDQAKPTHRMWTPHIPGGGIAHQLHQVCERLQLPLVVLLEFVAEGDNIPESILMANGLHSLLGLLSPTGELGSQEWVPPGSWHSFYSTRVPQMLYY